VRERDYRGRLALANPACRYIYTCVCVSKYMYMYVCICMYVCVCISTFLAIFSTQHLFNVSQICERLMQRQHASYVSIRQALPLIRSSDARHSCVCTHIHTCTHTGTTVERIFATNYNRLTLFHNPDRPGKNAVCVCVCVCVCARARARERAREREREKDRQSV
jgi:hypothetical protein